MSVTKRVFLGTVYLIGALFTNAYCRVYRWEDWVDNEGRFSQEEPAEIRTVLSTLFWPVYVAGRGAEWIVSHPPTFRCDTIETETEPKEGWPPMDEYPK